jgi:hypothetical protein
MSPWSAMPTDCLPTLRRAVETHAGAGTEARTTVLSLCIEAVAFAREASSAQVGTRARSAAHLLLELTCPDLDAASLRELSLACERAAVRRH